MTLQELTQRLARWTTAKSIAKMSADDKLILLDCINASIYKWYASAPENMRMTTVSHQLRGSESGTVAIVDGENTLNGLALQDYHLGASIKIGNSVNMNEIIKVSGTPMVLNSHTETGTVAYTIYFDTIMFTDALVSRMVNHPRILETGTELFRDDDGMRFVGAERRGSSFSRTNSFITGLDVGSPYRYVIENTGISSSDEARFMVRVDPIPDRVLTVVFDVVIDAPILKIHQLADRTKIPIPEQYILPHLLPLAMGELASTPIWEGSNAQAIIQKADSVPTAMRSHIQQNRGAPRNFIRTRRGF